LNPIDKKFPKRLLTITLMSVALISGCGAKEDLGKDIYIDAHPDDALIALGPVSTCLDRASFLKGGTSLSSSAKGYVMVFNRFTLQWKSTDTLFIKAMRITVNGSGIKGGTYSTTLGNDEVSALLARDQAIIKVPETIISSDDVSRKNTGYSSCGLVVGSIPLANDDQTTEFRARVTIEIIGTAEDTSLNDRFIRQRTTTTAHFYGG
jgi:hypothetical protein